MFVISASVTGAGMDTDIVCCFDPAVVVVRLREAFPEVEVIPEDFSWKAYDAMRARRNGLGGEGRRARRREARPHLDLCPAGGRSAARPRAGRALRPEHLERRPDPRAT